MRSDAQERELSIDDSFVEERLYQVKSQNSSWYADYVNYLACNILPPELTYQQRKKFLIDVKNYFWDDPLLFKLGVDGIHRRCVSKEEVEYILYHWHSAPYRGHASTNKISAKVLQAGFYWPTLFKDVRNFVQACDKCQRMATYQ